MTLEDRFGLMVPWRRKMSGASRRILIGACFRRWNLSQADYFGVSWLVAYTRVRGVAPSVRRPVYSGGTAHVQYKDFFKGMHDNAMQTREVNDWLYQFLGFPLPIVTIGQVVVVSS